MQSPVLVDGFAELGALGGVKTVMWWFFLPSKKPTPAEYAVLVVSSSILFVVVGVIALVFAFRAPASKHEVAVALAHRGFWCLGIGIVIAVAYWLYRRLKD